MIKQIHKVWSTQTRMHKLSLFYGFWAIFFISEHFFFFSLHLAVVNLVPVYIIIYFSAFRMDTVKCDTINFNDVVISSYS